MKRTKRHLPKCIRLLILTAAMLFCVVPYLTPDTQVYAGSTGSGSSGVLAIQLSSWSDLKSALAKDSTNKRDDESADTPTYYKLTADCTAGSNDTYIEVGSGRNVVLDLNGKTIDRGLTSAKDDGMVLMIRGSLALYDNSTGKTGLIKGGKNYNDNAGGVLVKGGTFNMYGGTVSRNYSRLGGGGVGVLSGGTFNMYDGSKIGVKGTDCNEASCHGGGGVYVSRSTFNMYGGLIAANEFGYYDWDRWKRDFYCGGGVYVEGGGTFNMMDGEISQNTSDYAHGAGVGVYQATFNMRGGTITGNKTYSGRGNGVYVQAGTFNMNGGRISGNISHNDSENGSGVYVYYNSTFNISDGRIYENSAEHGNSYSVYCSSNMKVSGKPVIGVLQEDNNINNSVYLDGTSYMSITGELTTGASIYVDAPIGKIIAKNDASYEPTESVALANAHKFHCTQVSGINGVADGNNVRFANELTSSNTTVTLAGNTSADYTGSVITPSINVSHSPALTEGTDYEVIYRKKNSQTILSSIQDPGEYTVSIRGKGNYGGIVSAADKFTINGLSISNADDTAVTNPRAGQTLKAAATVNGGIQWYRGDSADFAPGNDNKINGATENTYTLTIDDIGKYIKVKVGNETSEAVGPIGKLPGPEKPDSKLITGTATTDTITVTGPLSDENVSYEYRVARQGYNYNYAGSKLETYNSGWQSETVFTGLKPWLSYTVYVRIKETETTEAGAETYNRISTEYQPIIGVTFDGTVQEGEKLTAVAQPETANETAYYQWSIGDTADGDFTDIEGATKRAYTIQAADIGKYLKVTMRQVRNSTTSYTASAVTATAVTGMPRTVTIANVTGGSAAVTDPDTVVTTSNVTVTATPAAGWKTTGMTVTKTGDTSTSVTATADETNPDVYTYTQPDYDVTVTPAFAKIKYTIAAPTVSGNGTVTLKGVTKLEGSASDADDNASVGDTVKLAAVPDSGYYLADLTAAYKDGTENKTLTLLDGIKGGENDLYEFVMPAADITGISATFKKHEHSFDYAANDGTITAFCVARTGGCLLSEGKASLTLVVPKDLTYDGSEKAATIEGDTDVLGIPSISYTKDNRPLKGTPVETGVYTASISLGTGTDMATATVTYTIDPKVVTKPAITLSGNDLVYNGKEKKPVVESVMDGDVVIPAGEYKVVYTDNVDARKTTDDNPPTVWIVDNEGGNYSVSGNIAFTISQADNPTVVDPETAVMRGGKTIDLSKSVSMNGATGSVSYVLSDETSDCELTGSQLTSGTKKGTVTVLVTVAGETNYKALPETAIIVTITDKNTQELSFADTAVSKTYGDPAFTNELGGALGEVSYSVTDGEEVADVSDDGEVTIKSSGTAVITATAAETDDYEHAAVSYRLTVDKKAVTVKADDKSKDKGAADPDLTATVTGLVGDDTVTYALSREDGQDAGTYTITPTGDREQGSYTVTFETGTFTINAPAGSGDENPQADPASDCTEKINSLPAAKDLTLKDADAVKAARAAYNKLSDAQKAKIDPVIVKRLEEAEITISARTAYNDDIAAAEALTAKLAKVKNLKGKKVQLSWKKPSGKIKNTGYEIEYSTKKNFGSKTKSILVKKASVKKAAIKKLKKGKTYYFRVRTYTDVKNEATGKTTTVYGKWSNVKKIKVKK